MREAQGAGGMQQHRMTPKYHDVEQTNATTAYRAVRLLQGALTVVVGVHNRRVQDPVDVKQTCGQCRRRMRIALIIPTEAAERGRGESLRPVSLSSSYFTLDPRGISMTAFTISGAVSPIAKSCLHIAPN